MVATGAGLLTVTVKLQVEPSAALQETVVVPFGKLVPEAGELVTAMRPHSSAAVTVKLMTAEQCPGSVEAIILAGQLTPFGAVPDGL